MPKTATVKPASNDLSKIITAPVVIPDLTAIQKAPVEIVISGNGLIKTSDAGYVVVISNVAEQENALMLLKDIRARIKSAEEIFKTIKAPMNAAKDAVLQLEHGVIDPMKALERSLSTANSDFRIAQEQLAREEQQRLERIERDRIQAEADAEVKSLEAQGKISQAVNVAMAAASAPIPAVATVAPVMARVAGISTRASYSAKVVDLPALVRYCLENPALLSMFILPNETALNSQARQAKKNLNIPGVEVIEKYV